MKSFFGRLFGIFSVKPQRQLETQNRLNPADPKPFFRFYPACYEHEVFVQGEEACIICHEFGQWVYELNIYSVCEDRPVCARCISDDRLRERFGDDYSLHDISFSSSVGTYEQEVMQRTPGFPMFNPISWPAKNGIPMVYLGAGEQRSFWDDPYCRTGMKNFWANMVGDELDGPTGYIFVFKTLDDSEFGFALDFD